MGKTDYAALQSGCIEVQGQQVRTAPLSSLSRAREIAGILKEWIAEGKFLLAEPVRPMPEWSEVKGLQEQEGKKKECVSFEKGKESWSRK